MGLDLCAATEPVEDTLAIVNGPRKGLAIKFKVRPALDTEWLDAVIKAGGSGASLDDLSTQDGKSTVLGSRTYHILAESHLVSIVSAVAPDGEPVRVKVNGAWMNVTEPAAKEELFRALPIFSWYVGLQARQAGFKVEEERKNSEPASS